MKHVATITALTSLIIHLSCAEDQSMVSEDKRQNKGSYVGTSSGNADRQEASNEGKKVADRTIETPKGSVEPVTEPPQVNLEPVDIDIDQETVEIFDRSCQTINSYDFPVNFTSTISYLCNNDGKAKQQYRVLAENPYQGQEGYTFTPESLVSDNQDTHLELLTSMIIQKPLAAAGDAIGSLAELDTIIDGVTVTNTALSKLTNGVKIRRNIQTKVLFVTLDDDMLLNFEEMPSSDPEFRIFYSYLIDGEAVNQDNVGENKQLYIAKKLNDSVTLLTIVTQQSSNHKGIPSIAEQKFEVQADQLPKVYYGFLNQ